MFIIFKNFIISPSGSGGGVARGTLSDLLQEKILLHLLEGRERHGADDQGPQVGEALVEPPEEV